MTSKNIFLLAGDEEFLKEEWLRSARQRLLKEENSSSVDFNQFYAADADIYSVLAIAKTTPFLAKKRLIVLKNVEALALPSHQEKLVSYATHPSPDSVLILETNIKDRAFTGYKFLSELSKKTEVVFFKRLYDEDLLGWMNRRFLSGKKKITRQALELLKDLKGNNLKALDEEIKKLSTYAAERPAVTIEDVQQLVGKDIRGSIYDIIDAISQNDKAKALNLSFDFQNFKREDWGQAVGLFCSRLRSLLRAREYLKQGWALQKVVDGAGLKNLNTFQLDKFIKQAKKLKSSWLKKALIEVTKFDLEMKTTGLREPLLGWQMLLVRLLAAL